MGISRCEWTQPSSLWLQHFAASLKLGTYPGRNQENGSKECFCIINKNEWVKPDVRCARGGSTEKAQGEPPTQTNLLQEKLGELGEPIPAFLATPS